MTGGRLALRIRSRGGPCRSVGLDIRLHGWRRWRGWVSGTFDLVTSVEVIEHVADQSPPPARFRAAAGARRAASDVHPKRNGAVARVMVGAAEAVGYVP